MSSYTDVLSERYQQSRPQGHPILSGFLSALSAPPREPKIPRDLLGGAVKTGKVVGFFEGFLLEPEAGGH